MLWGRSSAGRASRSQCEGREFDPPRLHHFMVIKPVRQNFDIRVGVCIFDLNR